MAKSSTQTTQDDEFIEVALDEASHAQLMWFSKHQGYEYDPAETEAQTYNRIKSAWDHPTIKVPAVIEEPKQPVTASTIGNVGPEDRYGLPEMVTIQVHSDGSDDDEMQDIAHNGKTFRIKKGATVEIPWYVFKILDDAKTVMYSGGRDTGLGPERIVQSVSFTRIK